MMNVLGIDLGGKAVGLLRQLRNDLPTWPAPAGRRQSGRPGGQAREWRMIQTPTERGWPQDESKPAERLHHARGAPAFPRRSDQKSRLSPFQFEIADMLAEVTE